MLTQRYAEKSVATAPADTQRYIEKCGRERLLTQRYTEKSVATAPANTQRCTEKCGDGAW